MSIPEKARALRDALDRNNMPSVHDKPQGRGMMHTITVARPDGESFAILVEASGYSVCGIDGYIFDKHPDIIGAMQLIQEVWKA